MSERTRLLKINLRRGSGLKVLGQMSGAINVAVSSRLLGVDQFGVWLVLSSAMNWISVGDFGMGNSLKNRVAHLFELKREADAREIVSTTYVCSVGITVLMMAVAGPIALAVNWKNVLNTNVHSEKLVPVVFACLMLFSFRLITQLVNAVAAACQRYWVSELANTSIQLAVAIAGIILLGLKVNSLFVYVLVVAGIPLIVHLIASVVLYRGEFAGLRPSLGLYRADRRKELMKPGLMFFTIQFCGLIIYSTDNFIVSYLFGTYEVAVYATTLRYFAVFAMLFNMLQAPLWPSYASALAANDMNWIKKSVRKVTQLWLMSAGVLIALMPFSSRIVGLWLGDSASPPFGLCLACGVFTLACSYGSIFVLVVNASGYLRIQAWCSVIAALVNLPLSIALSKWLGSTGVIIATTLCLSYGPIVAAAHYRRIVDNRATGAWGR